VARVTDDEVKEIIETSITTTPFITVANLIVTERLANEGLGDSLLKEIERWLAAHLVAIRDQRPQNERIGDANITYQGRSGLGLDATQYGQQVKILDTSGKLANLGKRVARIEMIDFSTE